MRIFRSLILAALAALPLVPMALAQNAGTSTSGGWVPRTALKPEPGKLVVPKGYKAEVFVAGLDTPSSAAVDREGNVWVAISGNLFGPFEYEYAGQRIKNPVSGPHVKVFDKDGKHLKDIGVGRFGFVMNEIGYCAENNKVYIPEYSKHIWEISGVKIDKQGSDGMYQHKDMEVYAMGFRNQSGVRFGPKGSRFENALAVSDNGVNDLGNRRIANGAEKLWIVTEKGQDAGFPDKEGMGFVTNKRFSLKAYNGAKVDRPYPNLYIGDKPWVPQMPPYRFPPHVEGVRGVPLIVANPNPNGYINPVLEWDTNNPMDGIAWGDERFGVKDTLFAAIFGIIDNGPESLVPTWPAIIKIEFLQPAGVKWSYFLRNKEPGPNAYQKPGNRGGFERTNDVVFSNDGKTMYVVDYGELYIDYSMPSPFFTTPRSGVIWKVTYTGQ